MNIEVEDYGGHASVLLNGIQIGYFNYDTGGYSRDLSSFPNDVVYSRMLEINPNFRNAGIGTEAYKRFIGIMRAKGFRRIFAFPRNAASLRFMKRLGFRRLPGRAPIGLYELDIG